MAGRELSSEGFRALVSATPASAERPFPDSSLIAEGARRVIGQMLALEASGARLDCLRPYVHPATATEASLAVDLVLASVREVPGQGLIHRIVAKDAETKFLEWTEQDGPFLQVMVRLLVRIMSNTWHVEIPANVPVPNNTRGLNVQGWDIEGKLWELR